MKENTQTAAARKEVRELGGLLRLGGISMAATALIASRYSPPVSGLEHNLKAGFMALGLYTAFKMAGDCIMSAHFARDPVHEARARLKDIGPLRVILAFAVGSVLVPSVPETSVETLPETSVTTDPLASATDQSLKEVVITDDSSCSRGTSIITFDKQTQKTLVTRCVGP